jgi:plastocyanin
MASAAEEKKKSFRIPVTTLVILTLAGLAGVTYYTGSPPIQPSLVPSTSCPVALQIIVGNSVNYNYEQGTLKVVVGVNNTVAWVDDEAGFELHIITTAVPQGNQNWDLNMTQGQTNCLTLTVPGTYIYYYLNVPVPARVLIVEQASS